MTNEMNATETMDLRAYDVIVINTSAGKDSQAMMDYVTKLAAEQGVMDRVIAVHADLGKVEWKGTRDLAELHCKVYYHIPLHVVHRLKGDLLDQVLERGMWPDSANRYCTSDQKRDQVAKLHTSVTTQKITEMAGRAWRETPESAVGQPRQIRILNCMGFRAQESAARAKKPVLAVDMRTTNGKREVTNWLPIHSWTVEKVWEVIHASGVPYHYAYELGMPRLSCVFCIFAPTDALVIAGKNNPDLLDEYIRVEEKIGHTFKNGFRIAQVKELIAAGYQPKNVQSWNM